MFRRRAKLTLLRRACELVWPRMGFRRLSAYLMHRMARLPGTPDSIALGFACGAAVSFTPLMGLHFAAAALLAWAMRGNLLASAIGTAVGNPWTFPFIWMASYRLGRAVLGLPPARMLPEEMTFGHVIAHPSDALAYLFAHPWQVLVPWMLGGTLLGAGAWVAFFFPIRALVSAHQRRRVSRIARGGRRKQEVGT